VLWKKRQELASGSTSQGWNRYSGIETLEHHWDALADERKETFAQMAVVVQQFMAGERPESNEGEVDGEEVRDIAHLLARFAANNHVICDEESNEIGIGIYPLASMVNHSCTPNSAQVFHGKKILFKAIRKILPGEEVTISYVDLCLTRQERRTTLLESYHFDIDMKAVEAVRQLEHDLDAATSLKVYEVAPWPCDEKVAFAPGS